MAFATREELLAIEDIHDYESIVDINESLQRAESNILRLLNKVWWQKFINQNPQFTPGDMRADLLAKTEWMNPTCYYALAYDILPKIVKQKDAGYNQKIGEYHNLWEYDIRNLLQFGITYDADGITLQFVPDRQEFNYTRLRK
jgi:hypothetical protein